MKYKTVTILLIALLLTMAGALPLDAQVVKPEDVFLREKIASRGIAMAKIVTRGRLSGTTTEYYYFDSAGRLTGIVSEAAGGVDTLLSRTVTDGRITEQWELRQGSRRREEFIYDGSGGAVMKVVWVNDTLFSRVKMNYNSEGRLVSSYEIGVDNDTLRGATYHYTGGTLSRIDYEGTGVVSIEFIRILRLRVTRVFDTEGHLLMTRTAKYIDDGRIWEERVIVPGITAEATTIYRYRLGLLRTVLHPDGRRSRVRYSKRITS